MVMELDIIIMIVKHHPTSLNTDVSNIAEVSVFSDGMSMESHGNGNLNAHRSCRRRQEGVSIRFRAATRNV
jgi:hypothetical protein